MYTVRQLRNALIALSNSNTKSLKKRMSYVRVQHMLDFVNWNDERVVTRNELIKLPSLGKKIVDTFLTEMEKRG